MLNVIYSKNLSSLTSYPKGTILSRKQNGEHEYRFNEWEYFIKENGFEIVYRQLFLEKHKRNKNYKNDAKIIQNLYLLSWEDLKKKDCLLIKTQKIIKI